jgi:hypothetical protein
MTIFVKKRTIFVNRQNFLARNNNPETYGIKLINKNSYMKISRGKIGFGMPIALTIHRNSLQG